MNSFCAKQPKPHLSLSHLSQSSDGRSNGGSSSSGNSVSTTSDGLVTRVTVPDTSSVSLHRLLTTERTVVTSVLLDLQFLGLTTKGGTVTNTKLTSDTDLFSSLSPGKRLLVRCVLVVIARCFKDGCMGSPRTARFVAD
jgi:hypothetical protein